MAKVREIAVSIILTVLAAPSLAEPCANGDPAEAARSAAQLTSLLTPAGQFAAQAAPAPLPTPAEVTPLANDPTALYARDPLRAGASTTGGLGMQQPIDYLSPEEQLIMEVQAQQNAAYGGVPQ